MVRLLKDNSGIALILTILIISLIVTLTLQFNTSMRSDLYSASNFRDGVRLGCIARSGFDYALAVLFEDMFETKFDSLYEDWGDSKALSSNSAAMFDDGRFEVNIINHSGRIPINHLVDKNGKFNKKQKDILTRFLGTERFGLESKNIIGVIEAIKDWIDSNDEETGSGAENSFYQMLERPYSCKNAPLDFIEGLLLVKGITKELFSGTKEYPGISNYLTTYGDGKININTADPLVLLSLSDQIDQEMVEDIIAYRENEKNNLENSDWYKLVPGMSHVTIDPDLVTTSSTHFEIISEGFKDAMTKRVTGIVERSKDTLRILSWKIE